MAEMEFLTFLPLKPSLPTVFPILGNVDSIFSNAEVKTLVSALVLIRGKSLWLYLQNISGIC